MNKATITTPEAMDQERVNEDISMTPLVRLELAFQLSDLAQEIHESQGLVKKISDIPWIELPKRTSSAR